MTTTWRVPLSLRNPARRAAAKEALERFLTCEAARREAEARAERLLNPDLIAARNAELYVAELKAIKQAATGELAQLVQAQDRDHRSWGRVDQRVISLDAPIAGTNVSNLHDRVDGFECGHLLEWSDPVADEVLEKLDRSSSGE